MRQGRRNQRAADSKAASRKKVKFVPTKIRIVSGIVGGRKIAYNGDPATRPMKEKTREAVFSLLGGKLPQTFAVDLFAGTGVLAIESMSRGSVGAAIFEYSRPTMKTIVENLKILELEENATVRNIDTVRWLTAIDVDQLEWPRVPWIIYCCPPYRLWTKESEKICDGLKKLHDAAPVGSRLVCETDNTFDLPEYMGELDWETRAYPPAIISIAKKEA